MEEKVLEKVSQQDIYLLTTFLEERFGYDFSEYTITSFKRRLARLLDLFHAENVESLILRLKAEPSLIKRFIEEITVNVSEMFRDPGFWVVLKESFLPEALAKKEHINIWIAGSAAGEEVFSLTILLKENGWFDRVSIFATDLDDIIFGKALKGKYYRRLIEEDYNKNYSKSGGRGSLSDYAEAEGIYSKMDLGLLRNTVFQKHDLVKDKSPGEFDFVFCRNVMIYFNPELQNKVYRLLHQSVSQDGFLVISPKESMVWSDIACKFELINKDEKIFRKIAL